MNVTAILPFHDSPYIAEAIQSVAAQTRPPDELIAVSDAASDETTDRALAALDATDLSWTLIPRDEDSGDFPTPTNQAANHHATGDVYAFLFHDDRWLPEYLDRQTDALASTPPGVGLQWTGEYHIDETGERTGESIVSWPRTDRWRLFLGCWVPSPSACVVRAKHYHAIGGFDADLQPLADWDFYLRMWRSCALRSIDEPLMEFRQHAGQHATSGWDAVNAHRRAFIDKHEALFRRAGYYEQAIERHEHLSGLDVPPWA